MHIRLAIFLLTLFYVTMALALPRPIPTPRRQQREQQPLVDWETIDKNYEACLTDLIINGEDINITKCVRESVQEKDPAINARED